MDSSAERYCVIGAGAAGLVAARRLSEAGIPFEVLEAGSSVGGLWATPPASGPLYRNTHIISPKSLQSFADFPMPDEYPDFPHHTLVRRYLENYTDHFKIRERIRFNARVSTLERDGEGWRVTLEDGSTQRYKGVLIASGKHDVADIPEFAGTFDGSVLHARDYCDPIELRGRRVLVIGGGQSAIDLVAESALIADRTVHSLRRGLFSMPRYLFNRPFEEHLQGDPPLRETMARFTLPLLKLLGGAPRQCGTPELHFRDGMIHPTVGREFFRVYQQGDVVVKGGVARLDGHYVEFADGSRELIDVIYCATGYKLSYPFIDRAQLNWPEGAPRPDLYLHTFHPECDSLFVMGMMQPLGAHWTTYDEQAQLVTEFLKLRQRANGNGSSKLKDFERRRREERPRLDGGITYYRSDRKAVCDVDKLSFREKARSLRRWMRA